MTLSRVLKQSLVAAILVFSLVSLSANAYWYRNRSYTNCHNGYCTHFQSHRVCGNGGCTYHWTRHNWYR